MALPRHPVGTTGCCCVLVQHLVEGLGGQYPIEPLQQGLGVGAGDTLAHRVGGINTQSSCRWSSGARDHLGGMRSGLSPWLKPAGSLTAFEGILGGGDLGPELGDLLRQRFVLLHLAFQKARGDAGLGE